MGFDGVELLHRQMENESNDYLQRLKRRALLYGLDLCGLSTHQTFLTPDAQKRQQNVDHTIGCIDLAYKLGIPTIRVNTGTDGSFGRGRDQRLCHFDVQHGLRAREGG
jgi:sugar phosphate isomerase/epimerase